MKSLNKNTILYLILLLPLSAFAKNDDDSMSKPTSLNLHYQATYIYQYKPQYYAKYSGPNSLKATEEKQNSLTTTLYLGARMWKGAEIYINPEVAGGSGLSGAFGLGASSNGETFRVGNPEPTLYLARGYFTQTVALDNTTTRIAESANEIGGIKPANYLKFYIGKLCLGDIFDNNLYANSPRSQFMNWCLMNNGAWDYAANVRGYTYTFAAILQKDNIAYKAAIATLPTTANGAELNTHLNEEYSINAEISRCFKLGTKTGNIRLLGYYNEGFMGKYEQAIKYPDTSGLPNIITTRRLGRVKMGITLNADIQVSKNAGIFMRGGWNDGNTETWAFTEVDHSISTGVSYKGSAWKRNNDELGVAVVMNSLSKNHHNYLAAGGLGFQLGDGTLKYANETAFELYYNCKPFAQSIWITADYQFILNPGYNSDRGPLSVFSIRLHSEI